MLFRILNGGFSRFRSSIITRLARISAALFAHDDDDDHLSPLIVREAWHGERTVGPRESARLDELRVFSNLKNWIAIEIEWREVDDGAESDATPTPPLRIDKNQQG
jgi:hypothetical protein